MNIIHTESGLNKAPPSSPSSSPSPLPGGIIRSPLLFSPPPPPPLLSSSPWVLISFLPPPFPPPSPSSPRLWRGEEGDGWRDGCDCGSLLKREVVILQRLFFLPLPAEMHDGKVSCVLGAASSEQETCQGQTLLLRAQTLCFIISIQRNITNISSVTLTSLNNNHLHCKLHSTSFVTSFNYLCHISFCLCHLHIFLPLLCPTINISLCFRSNFKTTIIISN